MRRVLFRESGKAASVHNKQVLDVVCLAEAVQNGGSGILSHTSRTSLVAGEAVEMGCLTEHESALGPVENFFCLLAHFLPEQAVIFSETKVNDGDGNAVCIRAGGIDCHSVVGPCQHLAISVESHHSRLKQPNVPLEIRAKTAKMFGLVRIHEAIDLRLIVVAAGIPSILAVHVESGNIRVVISPIMIVWLGAH